ncbi:MAG: CoB--CoM heterodisulfide reductase iron-sulfur subunit B family protein [Candidatus Aminicenantes bacterium]|nr:MAG: CoB--CoM heterodisulfide reductase iron-sulfur subunit B family protein [Candidatus Aminicenantes bacterium]
MKISYYPGCTLKNNAKNFEDSTLCSLKKLDVEVEELPRWNCCGTVFSLATDDLIHHVAPIRNLIRVKESNTDRVMTLCAMCYNTLKRANERVKTDEESLDKINQFMYREDVKYEGDVKVLHLLELLRDEIEFENIAKKVVKPLKDLKIANYYGCMLVRPKEVGFDDVENPTVLENFTTALGATPIDFPYKTECCAAYQTVDKPEIVADRTYHILNSAQDQGAEIVSVSCPLCAFNLDHRQKETLQIYPEFKNIPILYFTQIMAIALGCSEETLRFDLHFIDPKPILKEKRLI